MTDDYFNRLATLITEASNQKSARLDRMSVVEILKVINDEDRSIPETIAEHLPAIAEAVELFEKTYRAENRIFYLGAGTSGRLGVLDAAECPPTFGTDPDRIIGVIAGGRGTLVRSKEGIEDKAVNARRDLKRHGFSSDDLLIAIAASGQTPYTLAGLEYARSIGAPTVFICANPETNIQSTADIVIPIVLGPEVVTGSTRMKAGTAQKLILNMISTAAMIRLGKTYGNLMVDLRATSAKLAARSRRILMHTLDVDYEQADELLNKADGEVKTAIAMGKLKCSANVARRKLKDADGMLYRVLGED
jgi:N-acetylmuramic acid 6-phosphate etherase